MSLTFKQQETLERMGAAAMDPELLFEYFKDEIPEIKAEFENPQSDVFSFYRKGFIMSELELRERIFTDANNGSSPAQVMATKFMDEIKFKTNV